MVRRLGQQLLGFQRGLPGGLVIRRLDASRGARHEGNHCAEGSGPSSGPLTEPSQLRSPLRPSCLPPSQPAPLLTSLLPTLTPCGYDKRTQDNTKESPCFMWHLRLSLSRPRLAVARETMGRDQHNSDVSWSTLSDRPTKDGPLSHREPPSSSLSLLLAALAAALPRSFESALRTSAS